MHSRSIGVISNVVLLTAKGEKTDLAAPRMGGRIVNKSLY
jgi:hypothetical protein